MNLESFAVLLPRLAPWATVCFVAVLVLCGAVVWRTGTTSGLRDVAVVLDAILRPWRRGPG